MKTELCDLLNIEYPIIQGAMAHITDGKFAAAVSNAPSMSLELMVQALTIAVGTIAECR